MTNFEFALTPSWSGTLRSANLSIYTTQYTQDIIVDHVEVKRSTRSEGPEFFIAPGSVHRVAF